MEEEMQHGITQTKVLHSSLFYRSEMVEIRTQTLRCKVDGNFLLFLGPRLQIAPF